MMKELSAISLLVGYILMWMTVIGFIISGWVLNIIALATLAKAGGAIGLMEILRIVGVFAAPLGAVLGWFA